MKGASRTRRTLTGIFSYPPSFGYFLVPIHPFGLVKPPFINTRAQKQGFLRQAIRQVQGCECIERLWTLSSSKCRLNLVSLGLSSGRSQAPNFIPGDREVHFLAPIFLESSKNCAIPLSVSGCFTICSMMAGGMVTISAPVIPDSMT
jgi:hypothetical protein